MNNAKRLPDAYAKNTDSNIYRLLQLVNLLYNDLKIDLKSIDETRDIQQATGKTLDKYGEMVNVSRGGATDEQYRTKILSQIARYVTESDCNSVISAIAHIFDAAETDISIIEDDMKVEILGLTIETLEKSGYKSREIEAMIRGIIPIGVEMSPPKYAGTLEIIDYISFRRPSDEAFNELADNYPVLFFAWQRGQSAYAGSGNDTGLSGHGEVPESFKSLWGIVNYQASGDYAGGSLGMLTGEDE